MTALLEIENLNVSFGQGADAVQAVLGASLSIDPGQTLCLVGESGSGKSTIALALMHLLPQSAAQVSATRITFDGRSLLGADEAELSKIRGQRLAMIFQDPMTSLNPVLTVGYQLSEAIRLHEPIAAQEARRRSLRLLDQVRIPDATSRLNSYPHQLSGGMRQRVMIAMALACNPKMLIADEPTTALDVTVQAQILSLIMELKQDTGAAVLFITHDLGVVAETADQVAVMYAGRIVEQGAVSDIFDRPAHAYTAGLLNSMLDPRDANRAERLMEIRGNIPRLARDPQGCSFAPRCDLAVGDCSVGRLDRITVAGRHETMCRRPGDVATRFATKGTAHA
jgi:oligopeptide/dipeptide ABC transporter ATP-binding protein